MRLYLDTSLVVAALTRETETTRIQRWLADQVVGELAISGWVVAEFSSALSIKLRTEQLDLEHRARALAAFADLRANSLTEIPITSAHFRAAALMADHHLLGLRSGDALHLAVAAENGATLCTLDRRLADGGRSLGVSTRLV